MVTPVLVDQYSRFMAEMFDERELISVSTVFQSFFGQSKHGSRTVYSPDGDVVEIDIVRGNEKVAGLIQRGTNSHHLGDLQKNTDTPNWTNFARVYPLGEEMGDITANQILKRVPGENPYQMKTRLDRMRMLGKEHYFEHIRRYVRLFEILAGSSLFNGTMPAILGTANSDMIYDFRRNAANTITVGTAWDATGADILADLDAGGEVLRENGKVHPNVFICDGDVMSAIIKDLTVQGIADNRRYEFIELGVNNPVPPNLQPLVESGATPRGSLKTPYGYVIWLFTYIDTYQNAAGVHTKYVPSGWGLLAHYGARCDRYFGPPEILPPTAQKAAWFQERFGFNMMAPPMPQKIANQSAIINPGMFYTDAFEANDGKKITVRTQAAPIYATTQTDAFVTFKGLLTSEDS